MGFITQLSELDLNGRYTYADYLTWRFRERVELIMGKVFRMSPAPSSAHQQIVSSLHGCIYHYLRKKHCKVFPAPFDVVLPSASGVDDTVVQPDIAVICDLSKITTRGCNGAPDLVVEVVSRSSIRKDLHEKYLLYEAARVKEYWMVHPLERSLIIFSLDDKGVYQVAKPLTLGDVAVSNAIAGLKVDLNEIFTDLLEEPEEEYGEEVRRV